MSDQSVGYSEHETCCSTPRGWPSPRSGCSTPRTGKASMPSPRQADTPRKGAGRDKRKLPRYEPLLSDVELSTFRSVLCPYKKSGKPCPNDDRCQYSHCMTWQRRNPYAVTYFPKICPNLRLYKTEGRQMRAENTCKASRKCTYSHTKEEQMYHPTIYKTALCKNWPEKCKQYYCPFAHGEKELRIGRALQRPETGCACKGACSDCSPVMTTPADDHVHAAVFTPRFPMPCPADDLQLPLDRVTPATTGALAAFDQMNIESLLSLPGIANEVTKRAAELLVVQMLALLEQAQQGLV